MQIEWKEFEADCEWILRALVKAGLIDELRYGDGPDDVAIRKTRDFSHEEMVAAIEVAMAEEQQR